MNRLMGGNRSDSIVSLVETEVQYLFIVNSKRIDNELIRDWIFVVNSYIFILFSLITHFQSVNLKIRMNYINRYFFRNIAIKRNISF